MAPVAEQEERRVWVPSTVIVAHLAVGAETLQRIVLWAAKAHLALVLLSVIRQVRMALAAGRMDIPA